MTAASKAELLAAVRRRPRRFGLPVSVWTRQRVGDSLAERTGMRGSDDTLRRALNHADIVRSRPPPQIRRPDPAYAVQKRRVQTPATS